MREVSLWVQTKEQAKVKFVYWDKANPDKRYETNEVATNPNDFNMTTLIADEIEPGRKYEYQLYINNEPVELDYRTGFESQKLWQWRGV